MARLSSPEFIGRDPERGTLAAALATAGEGRPSLVLVGGEAGIGKSRLVAEAADAARADGAAVLEGGAVDVGDGTLPFGPIVQALRGYIRATDPDLVATMVDPARAALAPLLPELGAAPDAEAGSSESSAWRQARAFEGVLDLLARLAERQTVVLVAEDLHWADRSTRELLAFLVRNLRDERLLVVGTFRSDELHRRHPLVPWLAELERLPRVERLELARFGRAEQAAQLGAILGRPPSGALVEEIHARSDGNPFFAEELLAVTLPSGHRADTESGPRPLPASLADALHARIATLAAGSQRILGVAAVAGRRVEHDLLVAAAEVDEHQVESALREALAHHLLVTERTPTPAYGFRHALAREAVYDELLPSERRRLHARYATLLAAIPTPAGADGARHLAELAHHWASAQRPAESLAASLAAAEAARATFAFAEAARHYERAIDLWGLVDAPARPADVDEVELFLRAAMSLDLAGESRRAVERCREAVRRHDGAREPHRAALLRARLGRLELRSANPDAAIATFEEARTLFNGQTPTAEAAEALATFAAILDANGRFGEAIDLAGEAIAAAIAVGARAPEGWAKNVRGAALAALGNCEEGITLLEEAVSIAEETGDPADLGRAYGNLAGAADGCGDPDRALSLLRQGVEVCRRLGTGRSWGVFLEATAAEILVNVGRWDAAEEILRRIDADVTPGLVGMQHHDVIASLGARRGVATYRRYLDDRLKAGEQMRAAFIVGPAYAASVEWDLWAGNPQLAAEAASRAISRASSAGADQPYWLIRLLPLGLAAEAERAVQARAQRDEATVVAARSRAGEYADQLEQLATQPLARLPAVRALAMWGAAEQSRLEGRSDPEAWAGVREGWAAVSRPFFEAYAAFRQAEALLAAHRPRAEAESALRHAHAIATQLGARPLLGWIKGLGRRARIALRAPEAIRSAEPSATSEEPPDHATAALDRYGLTRREREILALLAGGWTNRRIAEALFIGESTAGVHVANIIGKLGVANRVEAAAVAARLGLTPPEAAGVEE